MYLDPSYQGILTTDAKQQAKVHLAKTWKLLKKIQNQGISDNETITNVINQNQSNDSNKDDVDTFESFLRSHSMSAETSSCSSVPSIETILEQYDRVPYISYKLDIMDYWRNNKQNMPELYQLAIILIAIPATQVHIYY